MLLAVIKPKPIHLKKNKTTRLKMFLEVLLAETKTILQQTKQITPLKMY